MTNRTRENDNNRKGKTTKKVKSNNCSGSYCKEVLILICDYIDLLEMTVVPRLVMFLMPTVSSQKQKIQEN